MSLGVITSTIPALDGCDILTRTKAFIVAQGVSATLEHVFRDKRGAPVDLSAYLVDEDASDSASESAAADGSATLRIKEVLSCGPSRVKNPIWDLEVTSPNPAGGVLRATLLPAIVERAGIYQLSWGVRDSSDAVLAVNDGLLSVERSLFPQYTETLDKDLGPPTLNDIRMSIKDSGAAENLLLGDVEFADEEILDAIRRPIAHWNEALPPLRRKYTTRDFPFRENWRKATAGYLFSMAADHYRRNHLVYNAGGNTVADKAKEKEYLSASERLLSEYKDWVTMTKMSINTRSFYGSFGSPYA